MKIKVTVDKDRVAKALQQAPLRFVKEVRVEMKKQMRDVQIEAVRNHRFESHTHALEHSIVPTKNLPWWKGEVHLDLGIAVYARRIHQGWGTWRPDKFLINAGKRLRPRIQDALGAAVMRGLRRAGL